MSIDVENGIMSAPQGMVPLIALLLRTDKLAAVNEYERERGGRFEMTTGSRFGILMDSKIAESVFNRLFVRVDPTLQHFEMVQEHAPTYQIWKVTGDSIP